MMMNPLALMGAVAPELVTAVLPTLNPPKPN